MAGRLNTFCKEILIVNRLQFFSIHKAMSIKTGKEIKTGDSILMGIGIADICIKADDQLTTP